jgi:hypothetical protein
MKLNLKSGVVAQGMRDLVVSNHPKCHYLSLIKRDPLVWFHVYVKETLFRRGLKNNKDFLDFFLKRRMAFSRLRKRYLKLRWIDQGSELDRVKIQLESCLSLRKEEMLTEGERADLGLAIQKLNEVYYNHYPRMNENAYSKGMQRFFGSRASDHGGKKKTLGIADAERIEGLITNPW